MHAEPVTWKAIAGFPGYEVSSHGDVRRGSSAVKKPRSDRKGYLSVALWRDGKPTKRQLSRLVADAFVGPRPDGQVVRHRDGNNQNNFYRNLVYGTNQQNELDKREHGTAPIGENHPGAKLTAAQVAEIRLRCKPYSRTDGRRALAAEFGVTPQQIWLIATRRLWK